MVSVEYLKSTARLKESILSCETERLSLEQKLKLIQNSPNDEGGSATALSNYYRDLCHRETSMQRRTEVLLEELHRSENSLRNLSRRVEQLRSRRDQILSEHGPQWRDDLIDFLHRKTSSDTPAAAVPISPQHRRGGGRGGATAATFGATTAATPSATSEGIPLLHLSQLSKSSGGGTTHGAGDGVGGGWNTTGALLGLTESTIDSTGLSRTGTAQTGPQDAARMKRQQLPLQKSPQPPEPRQKTSALDDVDAPHTGGSLDSSRTVSDLTVSGLVKLLDFIDSELERAQPRILASYYNSSPPSDVLREEICKLANGPTGLPSHISAVSATCLVLEELELVVATRLPSGCVFPEGMVANLSAVRDVNQLERQIDMNLTDDARNLWCRLLTHMRRLLKWTGRPSINVARLFCPALLHQSASGLDAQLVPVVTKILDLASIAGASKTMIPEDDDEDDESVTIASDKMPKSPPQQPQQQPQQPPPSQQRRPPVVGESMQATAGSFDNRSESESEDGGRMAATVKTEEENGLNVTRNPELRASSSDAHVRAYAQALQDDSDESSVTELTQQSGTNRSGFFSHNSPQRNLKDSSAYQKLLYGAMGASANLGSASGGLGGVGVKSPDASSSVSTAPASLKQPTGVVASADAQDAGSKASSAWKPAAHELAKDDHDLESSDMDSELENSFRLRLSGGGTFKSLMASSGQQQNRLVGQKQPPATHVENDDEDFGGFYD